MIKLSKGIKPKVLVENASQWTTEYLICLNANIKPSDTIAHRYNNTEIKNSLEKEKIGRASCRERVSA